MGIEIVHSSQNPSEFSNSFTREFVKAAAAADFAQQLEVVEHVRHDAQAEPAPDVRRVAHLRPAAIGAPAVPKCI